jgi:hypothetical protein
MTLTSDGGYRWIGKAAPRTHRRSASPATSHTDFQFNPRYTLDNAPNHDLFGYVVFTYSFIVWGQERHTGRQQNGIDRVAGAK